VFVLNPAGEILVYPPDPALETGNMTSAQSALQTSEGRRTGLRFLEAANSRRGCGWVHYRIPRPGQQSPQWKSTYVERFVAPNNQVFLVGSGAYDSRMEKAFAVDEVEAAAALIAKEGRQAFAQLRDPKGRFIFHDTYVFVNDTAGVELVNPAFPALEGKNLSANRDSAGQFFVRDYIRLATSQGSGWVRYQWPRPSDPGKAVTKLTYVREVKTPQGETLVVGSGLYE
jgi:signal transduction histidine kinase